VFGVVASGAQPWGFALRLSCQIAMAAPTQTATKTTATMIATTSAVLVWWGWDGTGARR
jgi:hypothetical protein